jgi:hypothetical protein
MLDWYLNSLADKIGEAVAAVTIILLIAYPLLQAISNRRCPNCGKFWGRVEDSELISSHTSLTANAALKSHGYNHETTTTTRHKFRCKRCNQTWRRVETSNHPQL